MGYHVSLEEVQITIPSENLEEAYEIMCALGEDRTKPFSWMDMHYAEESISASEIFEELRFEVLEDEDGLVIEDFVGENIGDENIFFDSIAKLVTPGSYAVWRGEDGVCWKWVFDGKRLRTLAARMTFEEDDNE